MSEEVDSKVDPTLALLVEIQNTLIDIKDRLPSQVVEKKSCEVKYRAPCPVPEEIPVPEEVPEEKPPVPPGEPEPAGVPPEQKPDKTINELLNKILAEHETFSDILTELKKGLGTAADPATTDWYNTGETVISVATPTQPNDPDVISNSTTGATGYQAEQVYTRLGRRAGKLTIINDGTSNLFVISTNDSKTWTPETLLRPGEIYTFFFVWELRVRSPVAGSLTPIPSGGVYRITEYGFVPRNIVYDQQDPFGSNTTVGFAEHAARTGSPMVFDRRGNFLYSDDFESATLKFSSTPSAGGSNTRSTDTARTKDFSLKMITGPTAGVFNQIAYFHNDFHNGTKIGSQISFATVETGNFDVRNRIIFNSGTQVMEGNIVFLGQTLFYLNAAGGFTAISSNLPIRSSIFEWSTLKLVIDIQTRQYVRAIFLGQAFDLSGIALNVSSNTLLRLLTTVFTLTTYVNAAKTAYFDNYILTENEP